MDLDLNFDCVILTDEFSLSYVVVVLDKCVQGCCCSSVSTPVSGIVCISSWLHLTNLQWVYESLVCADSSLLPQTIKPWTVTEPDSVTMSWKEWLLLPPHCLMLQPTRQHLDFIHVYPHLDWNTEQRLISCTPRWNYE